MEETRTQWRGANVCSTTNRAIDRACALVRICGSNHSRSVRRKLFQRFVFFLFVSAAMIPSSDELSGVSAAEETETCSSGCCVLAVPNLHWDNVKDCLPWLCGKRPSQTARIGAHTVRLAPGESTTVLVRAHESVRLFRAAGNLTPTDFEFQVSNGSGLYRTAFGALSDSAQSLVCAPHGEQTSVVRIIRPANSPCEMEVAIFTLRREQIAQPNPICRLDGVGKPVQVMRMFDGKSLEHSLLQKNQSYETEVAGPVLLHIETRFFHRPLESRRNQTYRLDITVGEQKTEHLEFGSVPESRQQYEVDGCPVVLGQSDVEVLCVPPGTHRLRFVSSANLFARIRKAPPAGYHFPKNAFCLVDSELGGCQTTRNNSRSVWEYPIDYLQTNLDKSISHNSIRRILRDHRYRDNGHIGVRLAEQHATRWHQESSARSFARTSRTRHTAYSSLLPIASNQELNHRLGYFSQRSLVDPLRRRSKHVIADHLAEDTLRETLSRGRFIDLGISDKTPTTFRLLRENQSRCRLTIDRQTISAGTQIMVQIDESEPLRFEFVAREPFTAIGWEPTIAESALNALRKRHLNVGAGSIGGPFALSLQPANLLSSATAEFIVPEGATLVKIWSESEEANRPVRAAIQQRVTKPFYLTETGFLANREQVYDSTESFFKRMLDGYEQPHQDVRIAELQNQFVPIFRLLKQHDRQLRGSIQAADNPPQQVLPIEQLTFRLDRARALTRDEHWLPSLEAWAEVLPHLSGKARREAIGGRAVALEQLGEFFLLKNLLRGVVLTDKDLLARQQAYLHLRKIYREEGDTRALETLAATQALASPSRFALSELSISLFENRRYREALLVGLMLPESERPHEIVVRAAYQMQWWKTFVDQLNFLPESKQLYWKAQYHLFLGDVERAHGLLLANDRGQELGTSLETARRIRAELDSESFEHRALALLRWEQWQGEHPGPFIWTTADHTIRSFASAAPVYAVDRDLFSRYYRATSKKPLKAVIYGPTSVRIESRPIHESIDSASINDWLVVDQGGKRQIFAINSNQQTLGLEISGDDRVVGRADFTSIDLGPGRHELSISCESSDVLLRLFARRPETPSGVLPMLQEEVVRSVLDGTYGRKRRSGAKCDACVNVVENCCCDVSVDLVTQAAQSPPQDVLSQELDSSLATRIAQRLGEIPAYLVEDATAVALDTSNSIGIEERLAILEKCDSLSHISDEPRILSLDSIARIQLLLKTNDQKLQSLDLADIVSKPVTDAKQLDQKLALVGYIMQNRDHDDRLALLIKQNSIKFPTSDLARRLAQQACGQFDWTVFHDVASSAGISSQEATGWQPEHPMMRTRRSLLDGSNATGDVVYGRHRTIVNTNDEQPISLVFELELASTAFLPTAPVAVALQANDGAVERIAIDPKSPLVKRSTQLPAGENQVRFWIEQPRTNQYVRLRAFESTTQGLVPVEKLQQRFYHAATQEEPVELLVQGPTLLRIDERQGDNLFSRYRFVPNEVHRVVLKPNPSRKETHFRIHRYSKRATTPAPPVEPVLTINPVAPVPHSPMENTVKGHDVYASSPNVAKHRADLRLFEQLPITPSDRTIVDLPRLDLTPLDLTRHARWTGTRYISAGYRRRQAIEEDQVQGIDQFLEAKAGYREFDPWTRQYQHSSALVRAREQGGTSFGLSHRSSYEPIEDRRRFSWYANFFGQHPQTDHRDVDEQFEWSASVGARISQKMNIRENFYHTPSLAVYGRYLSLKGNEEGNPYGLGRVDQDVYTLFKSNHRAGITLSDRFVRETCLDTKWWARPSVSTNEDVGDGILDRFGLHTGTTQLYGRWLAEGSYRYTRYLNDRDRFSAANQHVLYFNAIRETWPNWNRRTELSMQLRYDILRGDMSGYLLMTWFWDRDREYRDFRNYEIDFEATRRIRGRFESPVLAFE